MIPCISLCNYWCENLAGEGGSLSRASHNKQPCYRHPAAPSSHTWLTSVPTTVVDLCCVVFSISVDEASQYPFAFAWEEKQFTWRGCLRVLLRVVMSPKSWRLIWMIQNSQEAVLCCTMWVISSSSQASSQEGSIHILTSLTLKK